MTTLRRLFPAALTTASLALAAAPAGAALNPVFDDSTPLSDGSSMLLVTNKSIASSHGRVVAVYLDNPAATGTLKAVRLDSPSGSWSAPETISGPGTDVQGFSVSIVADGDGNMTAIWREEGTGSLRARTMLKGESAWGTEQELTSTSGNATIEPGANGTVVVAWGEGSTFKVRTREAGSENWLPAVSVLDVSPHYANELALDVNASGDAILLGDTNDGGTDKRLRAARFDHQAGTWAPAASPVESWSTSNWVAFRDVAIAPDGSALAVWVDPAAPTWAPIATARSSYSAPGSASWSAPEAITASGQYGLLPQVVADRGGNFVAIFQGVIDDGSDMLAQLESSRAITRTRSAATGTWSEPEMLMGDRYGGAGMLTVDDNYNIAAILISGDTLDPSRMGDAVVPNVNLGVTYRPDGEAEFGATDTVFTGDASVNGSMPNVTLDEDGNPAALLLEAMAGTNNRVRVALGDANGPDFGSVSVPATATTGETVSVSASASDRWSTVDSIGWNFGDGSSATGGSAAHTFDRAGSYTVTITATDEHGLTSTQNRTIVVADPAPADQPDESDPAPKTLAPVLEAKLAGKTITIHAKMQLRSGKRCTGHVAAKTAFGGRTYRTTLKLKTAGGKCRAQGTIKLKKTPSLRTKLRISISGKQIKTRTLTSKRG